MKLVLLVIVAMALGAVATHFALQDPGYILISRTPWTVETTLVFFAVALLLAFLLFYLLLRFLSRILNMPHNLSAWREERQRRKAQRTQAQGITRLLGGKWGEAEKQLMSGLDSCETPMISYLGAARAAQQMGDMEKRDEYLALAHESAPSETLAVGLTQAELQYVGGQPEQALATLSRLRGTAPKNRRVIELLMKAHRKLRDWRGLAALIPTLRREQIIDADEIGELALETFGRMLQATTQLDGDDGLKKTWSDSVPREWRDDPALVVVYARRLLDLDAHAECENVIRSTLRRRWDANLAYLYGLVQADDSVSQLKTAESWLASHQHSTNLLLTAGRLAVRNQLWGKARSYFETAVSSSAPAELFLELGRLLEQLGEHEKARDYYRQGLEPGAPSAPTSDRSVTAAATP